MPKPAFGLNTNDDDDDDEHVCDDKDFVNELTSTLKMEAARFFRNSGSFY